MLLIECLYIFNFLELMLMRGGNYELPAAVVKEAYVCNCCFLLVIWMDNSCCSRWV